MKPSIGRIVHYFETEFSDPLPAMVTRVWSDDCVNLQVFQDGPGGLMHMTSVTQRSESNPGWVWDWPPRVES